MSTDADLEAAFDELVSVTSALEAFPFDDFADRLHNKARECVGSLNNDYVLQGYIDRAPNYPPEDSDADLSRLDGFEVFYLIYRLSLSATSDGIASINTPIFNPFVSAVSLSLICKIL
jgi:hypothetical protein